ncbi:MAG: 30S ribosomal protein S4 [Chloroflexi bacterium]|nr:MAG: 30S ribosomal protein S4 [Chloroflexota bacterium]PIE79611.1 MAG: 30S ribosomal protein S4 [Chloroflexota bacterium]
MSYTGPKAKLSRRLGIPLTPKAAKVMERKPYPPGQHGREEQYRRGRQSAYKQQLLEKQRLRAQYNIRERQMRSYYREANQKSGNTGENLIQILESRLDAVVLRGGLATTIYAARQYVNHGHIRVNGKKVDIPSYRVKPGDVVSVKDKSRRLQIFQHAIEQAIPPKYLELSADDMAITVNYLPQREEVPIICELSKVIEFYSR